MDSIHAVARSLDGHRLSQARRLRRLTRAELASRIKVSPTAIGKYERGMRIRPHLLVALAAELEMPIQFFAAGRPSFSLSPVDLHLRRRRRLSAADRNWAAAFAELAAEEAEQAELDLALPPVNVPQISGDPADAARQVRFLWRVPEGPIHDVKTLLRDKGLVVVFSPNDEAANRVGNFSTSVLGRPVLVVSGGEDQDTKALRYGLVRELGHLVLRRQAGSADDDQAALFADVFLWPVNTPG